MQFKIDIHNGSNEDKDLNLFGEDSLTSSNDVSAFVPTDEIYGNPVYNPSNGLFYCPTENAIVITDTEQILHTLPVSLPIGEAFGIYNPANQTVYFATANYFIAAINGIVLTELPIPYISYELTLAGNNVYVSILDS